MNEKQCFNLINKYIFPKTNLIHGDSQKERLPDIYSQDKKIGIEVTYSELTIDHLQTKLFEYCTKDNVTLHMCKDKRNEYDNIKEFKFILQRNIRLAEVEEEAHLFRIVELNGELAGIMPIENARKVDYSSDIFKERLFDKLEKLQKGNYNGVKQVYFCVSSAFRAKDMYEVEQFINIYKEAKEQEAEKTFFKGVILVFYDAMYFYDNITNEIQKIKSL